MTVLTLLFLTLFASSSWSTLPEIRNGDSLTKVFADIINELSEKAYDVTVVMFEEDKALEFNMKVFSEKGISIKSATGKSMDYKNQIRSEKIYRISNNLIMFFKNVARLMDFIEYFVISEIRNIFSS